MTFGEDDSGNDLSSTEYLPWYGESWKSGPSLDAEYARKGHNGVKTILKSNWNFHQIPQFHEICAGFITYFGHLVFGPKLLSYHLLCL